MEYQRLEATLQRDRQLMPGPPCRPIPKSPLAQHSTHMMQKRGPRLRYAGPAGSWARRGKWQTTNARFRASTPTWRHPKMEGPHSPSSLPPLRQRSTKNTTIRIRMHAVLWDGRKPGHAAGRKTGGGAGCDNIANKTRRSVFDKSGVNPAASPLSPRHSGPTHHPYP